MTTTTATTKLRISEANVTSMYRLGCLVDSLRNTSAHLIDQRGDTVSVDTHEQLAERYTRLRDALAGVVPDPVDMLTWTEGLGPGARLSQVFAAAADLAAYVDTVLADRAFTLGWVQRERAMDAMPSAVTLEIPAGRPAGATTGHGQYL